MHAPAALPRWIEELPRDRPIAVYCICGFQVSGTAVMELRWRGYDARAVVGGITAWHAIGGVTGPLDTSTYEGGAWGDFASPSPWGGSGGGNPRSAAPRRWPANGPRFVFSLFRKNTLHFF